MTVNKQVVFNKFSFNLNLLDLAMAVLNRIDPADLKDDPWETLYEAVDSEMTYTSNQWKVMRAYQTPEEANYYRALEDFEGDLMECINEGAI